MLIRALKRLLQQPGAEAPQPKSASPIWRRVCATVLAVISAWGISCDQTAWAQQEEGFVRNRSESVRGRAKPEYEAPGVSAGSFRFFPEVSLIEEYSDNVFATDTVEEEDFITALEARGRFASNWSSNALNIDVGAQSRFYSEFDDENTTDWSIGADGRIDILRELFVTGVLTFEDTHEARADQPTADLTTEPVQYTTSGARLGIVRRLNRVQVSGNASYTTFDYDDTPLVGGGALEQDDRDRAVTELGVRGDYALSPDAALFASLTGNWREYDEASGITIERDSEGAEALVGANFEFSHLARGEVGVGYLTQSYDDPTLADTSGFATHARVEWFIDPLVTVTASAVREVRDAGVVDAGGYVTNGVTFDVDYEFRRNVIFGASLGYSKDEYDGIDREDERSRIQLNADYLLNSSAALAFELGRFTQESTGGSFGRNYTVDRAMIVLRLRR